MWLGGRLVLPADSTTSWCSHASASLASQCLLLQVGSSARRAPTALLLSAAAAILRLVSGWRYTPFCPGSLYLSGCVSRRGVVLGAGPGDDSRGRLTGLEWGLRAGVAG